jgi:hypothetical protein
MPGTESPAPLAGGNRAGGRVTRQHLDTTSVVPRLTLDAASDYHRRGLRIVPIPSGSKACLMTGWQDFEATVAELPRLFSSNENIGVVLGAKSGHLADLDLDCREAIALADLYLPATDAVFGRRSKLRSHRLFIAPGAEYESFTDPMTGDTLLEIRADGREDRDGDKGAHQTLFPPSIADGERREWCGDVIAPRLVEADTLRRAAAWLAIGCLVARHISDYAAHRPDNDFVALLDEFDVLEGHGGKLRSAARRWLGIPDDQGAAHPQCRPRPKRHGGRHPNLAELVGAIPNDADWPAWNQLGMAIFNASEGSEAGFAVFDAWSRKSAKYDRRAIAECWRNYHRSPPNRIGMGSLIYLARQYGWTPRAEAWR